MSRSLSKVWVHVVFATKNRAPLIVREKDEEVYKLMFSQLSKLECDPVAINGMPDHVHLLFQVNYKISLQDIVKQVKGATSYYVNSQNTLPKKLDWQDGFRVFSVSPSLVGKAKLYIDNQKRHHSKLTHQQECIQLFESLKKSEEDEDFLE